jgi:hypothetical protein
MFTPQARFDPSAPKPIAVPYINTSASDLPSGTVVISNSKVVVVLGSGIRGLGSQSGPNTGSVAVGFGWFDFLCDASTFTTPNTAVYWNASGSPVDQAGSAITALVGTGCLTTNPAGAYYVGMTHPEQPGTSYTIGGVAQYPSPLALNEPARARAWLEMIPTSFGGTFGIVAAGGIPQDIYTASATQNFAIGTIRETSDGRRFRYSKAGGGNITRALMQQSAAAISNFIDVTQTGHAQVIGATAITILCSTGSANAANYFAGGKLIVTTGTNLGDIYNIVSSTLETTDTLMDLVLAEPLRHAIAVTDKVTLIPNRNQSTIVATATTLTGSAAGVPLVDVTAGYYYWAQTRGPAPIIVDTGDTLVVGGKAGVPATDAIAGTAGVATATGYAFPVYGTVLWIGTAAEPALINLELE